MGAVRIYPALMIASAVLYAAPVWAVSLSGLVRDPQGRSVPRAYVLLGGSADDESPWTTTREDGTFEFPALPSGTYSVWFRADGFAPTMLQSVKVADLQSVRLSPIALTLEGHAGCWYNTLAPRYETSRTTASGVEVFGHIVPPGKVRTTVTAVVMTGNSEISRSVAADRAGNFRVLLPHAGVVQMHFARPGSLEVRTPLMGTETGDRVTLAPIQIPKPGKPRRFALPCE